MIVWKIVSDILSSMQFYKVDIHKLNYINKHNKITKKETFYSLSCLLCLLMIVLTWSSLSEAAVHQIIEGDKKKCFLRIKFFSMSLHIETSQL